MANFSSLTLTDRAAERVNEIMSTKQKDAIALRVGIKKGGCAGFEYTMDYASQIEPLDEIVKSKGVTILIDSKALLFLLGTEMDYVTEKMSSKFTFSNPNQTSACGCGESVEITPITDLTLVRVN
ncbi:MAG: iron-sulfur cluster assembly accessory protein [Rhizobiales bacterium]|nr:iron-sulfur cluster assembly accessory protein [Hyphomicrobiales bacterium]NRB12941.1 iron-sulfur cluster assembly accessory protein [Hyphomicrobiales bacterium]